VTPEEHLLFLFLTYFVDSFAFFLFLPPHPTVVLVSFIGTKKSNYAFELFCLFYSSSVTFFIVINLFLYFRLLQFCGVFLFFSLSLFFLILIFNFLNYYYFSTFIFFFSYCSFPLAVNL